MNILNRIREQRDAGQGSKLVALGEVDAHPSPGHLSGLRSNDLRGDGSASPHPSPVTSDIFEPEKKSSHATSKKTFQVLPSPCRSCGTPAAWELVYDGSLHCPECEPPPGRALVRRWWTIWLRPRRPDDGPIPPGFATARFSGAGLTPEWIEMDHPKRI